MTLGDWDCKPVSLQLQEGAQQYHGRPFPTPKKHLDDTKKEIQRLCDLGVLQWQADSEWALPTFIIPKKYNTIRVVSDFRDLNKRIARKSFPIPKINMVLQELESFTMPVPLISTWATTRSYWIQMHPKYAPLSCRIVSMLTYNYQCMLHVLLISSKL